MKKVIVIGGGVAGLKAAQDLAKKNIQVTILEARNRLGGRIHTVRASDDITAVELGASYWEGLNSIPFYQRYLKTITLRLDEKKSKVLTLDRKLDIDDFLSHFYAAIEMIDHAEIMDTGNTFTQFMEQVHASYWTNRFLENCLLHHCTPLEKGGFPTFSRTPVPDTEVWNTKDADFTFVRNGYDQVIKQMEKECLEAGVEIILNCPVTKIIDNGLEGVQLQTAQNTYTANKIISTIPIGVLKNEAHKLFSPALSSEKMQAIATLGVHDATRVLLEFPGEPFWDNIEGPYIYLDSKDSRCLLEIRNAYPLTGKAILISGKYSDVARALYQKYPDNMAQAEKEIVARMISDLRKAYPDKTIPEPIKSIVYCWTHDPFAQGAYPYRSADITEAMQKALERFEGNIYFAGADFSRFGFCVHNAYANGENVARDLGATYRFSI